MNVFNGKEAGGDEQAMGGILHGLGNFSNITNDTAEVLKLKSQLSSKTNHILQLSEDKEVLE